MRVLNSVSAMDSKPISPNAVWSSTWSGAIFNTSATAPRSAFSTLSRSSAVGPAGVCGAGAAGAAAPDRPFVFLLVVGETARAANFGLAGYARQTTPELAKVPGLVYFTEVS